MSPTYRRCQLNLYLKFHFEFCYLHKKSNYCTRRCVMIFRNHEVEKYSYYKVNSIVKYILLFLKSLFEFIWKDNDTDYTIYQ